MNVYIPFTARLPSAYQEVEWIGNSGTQYIDTGVAVPNHKVIANIEYTNFGTWWMYLGSYLGASGSIYYRLYGGYGNDDKQWCYGILNSYGNVGGAVSLNTKYELELSTISGNMYFKHNGTTYGSSSSTYSTSLAGNFGILGSNSTQSWEAWNSAKVYDYKIYDNTNTLVRDFVPCYRKSDSVIGMYDLVNDQFYTNSGSGVFTKGSNVYANVLKNAYIGEYKGFVFDFQNNGLSGCTLSDSTYASIVPGEGISMSGETIDDYGTGIQLPSSVYGKAIKQVILNCYYPTSGYGAGKGFGCYKNGSYCFRYSREEYEQNNIGFSEGQTTAQNIGLITGEITITMNFGDGVISGTVNNTSFSVSNSAANTIRDSFIDGTFRLLMVSWRTSSISYLRKATIITE